MNTNLLELSKKYIFRGKEYLSEEYGSYAGKITGMDVDEDSSNSDYRNNLSKVIKKDVSVNDCWWEQEHYGYTLWIHFI